MSSTAQNKENKMIAKQPTFKKLILDELKAAGLSLIASKITSIRFKSYAGGCSVNVTAKDCVKEEREQLEKIVDNYQECDFDGMQDLQTYRINKASHPFRAKYAFVRYENTPEFEAKTMEILASKWDILTKKVAGNVCTAA